MHQKSKVRKKKSQKPFDSLGYLQGVTEDICVCWGASCPLEEPGDSY